MLVRCEIRPTRRPSGTAGKEKDRMNVGKMRREKAVTKENGRKKQSEEAGPGDGN
jgi:hypothetical protein